MHPLKADCRQLKAIKKCSKTTLKPPLEILIKIS